MSVATEQDRVTRRYDRLAPLYDICNAPMELFALRARRRRLLARARGRVLEAGLGTGRNLDYYSPGVELTVTLLRSEPGESRFTCGLGMLQRRLVVE